MRNQRYSTLRRTALAFCASLALLLSPAVFAEEPESELEKNAEQTLQSAENQLDDAGITAKVKTELATTNFDAATDIDVDTNEGVVTLTGTVDRQQAKATAAEIARDTEGVQEVRNQLKVRSDQMMEDDQDRYAATSGSDDQDRSAATDSENQDRVASSQSDDELPRTASPLPLVLLTGLGGLGVAAGLRRRRK